MPKKSAKRGNKKKAKKSSQHKQNTDLIFKSLCGFLVLVTLKVTIIDTISKPRNDKLEADTLYANSMPGMLDVHVADQTLPQPGPPGIGTITPEKAAKIYPGSMNPYRANAFINIKDPFHANMSFKSITNTEHDDFSATPLGRRPAPNSTVNRVLPENFDQMVEAGELKETGKDAWWKKKRLTDEMTNFAELQRKLVSWYGTSAKKFAPCPGSYPQMISTMSKYQTDKTKFLTGVLIWGPNNQLRGLRELIFLAIKLKRTLVLPPFFKHYTMDGTATEKSEVIKADFRIDISHLSNLIPIVHPDKFGDTCGHKFDVLFAGRRDTCHADKIERIDALTKFYGFQDVKIEGKGRPYPSNGFYCQNLTQPMQPDIGKLKSLQENVKKQLMLPFEEDKIVNIYPSDGACALSLFVYKSFNLKSVIK